MVLAVPFAVGAVTLSHTLDNGQVADADQVMANFADLKTAVDALEAGGNAAATYCGSTPSTNGSMGGYAGAKSLCETACSNAAARMCTSHDLVVSAQLGILPPVGDWYSSATLMTFGGTRNTYDCNGWTSSSSSIYGPEVFTGGRPDSNACNESHPVACCL
jgi:hypothetical protein